MTRTGSIFDIKRYAIHDGPGIRTTVFFKGCPLHCNWCHNPESISPQPQVLYRRRRCIGCQTCVEVCPEEALTLTADGIVTDATRCRLCTLCGRLCPSEAREFAGREETVEHLLAVIEKDVVFYDESGGGVTFSGGEPLMQPDFLLALLEGCHQREIHCAVDTSGHADEDILLAVAAATDLFLYDLKLMDADLHRHFTGHSNRAVLNNLRRLVAAKANVLIRFPVLPGINDGPENIDQTGAFIKGLPKAPPVELLAYHPNARHKYRKFNIPHQGRDILPPDDDQIRAIKVRLESYGLKVLTGDGQHEPTH